MYEDAYVYDLFAGGCCQLAGAAAMVYLQYA
jgi:hypothetical protein